MGVCLYAADPNRIELLRLVSKGVNRTTYARRHTAWHERSIQRYFKELEALDLVSGRFTPTATGVENIYSVTDRGREVLQQGVLPRL